MRAPSPLAVRGLLSALLALFLLAGCSGDDGFGPTLDTSGGATNKVQEYALVSPARLAAYDKKTLLVSDYDGKALYHLDRTTLRLTRRIPVSGQPTGVAYARGRYFVGNKTFRSVDVYNPAGQLLFRLGEGKGAFQQVNDLAVDEGRERVYVLDTRAARIRVFDFEGNAAGPDLGAGLLQHPTALTLDPASGNLLVSDFMDPGTGFRVKPAQVWMLSPAGAQLGTLAGGTASFSRPQGLSVAGGFLYLTDVFSGEVQVFNLASRQLVRTLGTLGAGPGELRGPLDVLVEEGSPAVFVADNRNGRITLYAEGGLLP